MAAGDGEVMKACLCAFSAKDQVPLPAIVTAFPLAPLTVYCDSGEAAGFLPDLARPLTIFHP